MMRIALSKGYLLGDAEALLARCGIVFDESLTTTRQLQVYDKTQTVCISLIRPWDVPVFVAHGAADLGIVGTDVLAEQTPNVRPILKLPFGHCRLVLAGPDRPVQAYQCIATKYPRLTRAYFQKKHCPVTVLKLYGSIESAPLTGLADHIVDLTATGATLAANKLVVYDTILDSQAELIANPV